jgi:hypothetical protein
MLRCVAVLALAVVVFLATATWYGEQRYKDCLYEAIGSTQADNTGASSTTTGLEQVGRINCSRSPF